MFRKLLPILFLIFGTGAGVSAGLVLRPAHHTKEEKAEAAKSEDLDPLTDASEDGAFEYVKMHNQFVVPIVGRKNVSGLVLLSLSLEVRAGQRPYVYEREPKLRDSFLQVLFDHANFGGFDGPFTNASNMDVLRRNLREIAQRDIGETVSDVLILDITRQDY